MIENKKKTILFILGQFVPEGGIPVLRHLRYIQYLKSKDVGLLVLAPDKGDLETQDLSLKKYVPKGINIIRYRYSSCLLGEKKTVLSIPVRLRERINVLLRTVPPDNDFCGWFISLIRCAIKVVWRYSPSVIYSSSCPYGVHILSLLIKKLFHVRWIADFRDEWSDNPFRSYSKSRKWLDRKMEKQVLKNADSIIVTTETYKNQLISICPYVMNKVHVISNGYFHEDFAQPIEFRNNRFMISYVGSFYSHQQPWTLIKSLRSLCDKGLIAEKDIVFRIYGIWNQQPKNLPAYVEVMGTVTHEEAVNAIRSSDINYLLVSRERGAGNVPGKTWEYLASGRPIIAEVPIPGETFRILNNLKCSSEIIDCGDQEKLSKIILVYFKE